MAMPSHYCDISETVDVTLLSLLTLCGHQLTPRVVCAVRF